MNRARVAVAVTLFVLVFCGAVVAEIPQMMAYQGRITDNSGNPVSDGIHAMRFRIYNAEMGGSLLWDSGDISVTTSAGVFSAALGESPQPTLDLDFDQDYWLSVRFEGEDQLPRRRLGSAGYAYMAGGLVPGTEIAGDLYLSGELGVGTTSPDYKLDVRGNRIRVKEDATGHWIAMRTDGGSLDLQYEGSNLYVQSTTDGEHILLNPSADNYVGIGLTDPNRKLYVRDDSTGLSYPLKLENRHSTVNEAAVGILFSTGGSGSNERGKGALAYEYTSTWNRGSFHMLQDSGANPDNPDLSDAVVTVRNDGRVGIGTTNPGGTLHASRGSVSATPWISIYDFIFENNDHSVLNIVAPHDKRSEIAFSDSTRMRGAIKYSHPDDAMSFRTAGSDDRLYIDSSGNVGVGTTAPSARLHAETTSPTGIGILARATATTAASYGGTFESLSASGTGVYGNGGSRGVHGASTSSFGAGVYGSGDGWGVYGLSSTHWGAGVEGVATSAGGVGVRGTGGSRGVEGEATATGGIGIRGISGPNGKAAEFLGDVLVSSGDMELDSGTLSVPVLTITGGSDLSERFDIRTSPAATELRPGAVVSIDPRTPGELAVSAEPYDRCVAGVISGAGGVAPGMLMGQAGSAADGAVPVALSGRVYCLATAANGAIRPGDLLTSSDTPGHAMKVSDHARAQGAIIGKAMSSLVEGEGLVLLLVSLQ